MIPANKSTPVWIVWVGKEVKRETVRPPRRRREEARRQLVKPLGVWGGL